MKQIWKLMIVGNILKQVSILLALYSESITQVFNFGWNFQVQNKPYPIVNICLYINVLMNIDELTHTKRKKKIVNKSLDEHALNCTF